ncbi:MAG TPA: CotH kinase family protein [Bacteroidia bacterium]|nr:CotH kinase family protein [Bacteroidia bacterium]
MKQKFFLSIALLLFFINANSQSLYDINTVQDIEINFPSANWDSIMDVYKNTTEEYYMANWVKINGIQYDSAGVRFKGNSSYNAYSAKNPLHISLDEFKSQDHQGFESIKLSNGYGDPSFIREVLGYGILKNYMHCPQSNFAKVTINGVYYGVFTNDESIDKKFISEHFYSDNNCFVKCSSELSPSAASKNSFKYINADSTSYLSIYDMKSDYGWTDFIDLCNVVTNNTVDLPNKMDIDRAIWMLAFNNLFVNLDSYNGVYAQNHYVYKDNTGHFNSVIWDLNMCFGAFPYAGQGTIGMGQKTVPELIAYSPFAHATDIAWPLINIVLGDSTMKRKFLAHYKTMLTENLLNGNYLTAAAQYQSIVDSALNADLNKLFSYQQFQNGLNTDVTFGNFTVPGISNLLEARKQFLQTVPELIATEPNINTPVFSSNSPLINSVVELKVAISNANNNSAYVGYRFNVEEKFLQLPLFDDGLHNDVNANDGIFGNSITITGSSMQYYIYAENDSIGKFLPARAEHEFYTLNATFPIPSFGSITINEFLASNTSGQQNEIGAFEDWIELYNNTDSTINLHGLFLSDNFLIPNKYAFPENTLINPHGFITVWADQETISTNLHANFKLSASGEQILISDGNSIIIDSLTFGVQTVNISMARCPDGSGNFSPTAQATFNGSNCIEGIETYEIKKSTCFPNPSAGMLTINFGKSNQLNLVKIFDLLGNEISNFTSIKYNETLDLSDLNNGIYFLTINQGESIKLIINK